MSEEATQEPTMEEILASIRRIISEDDVPAADAEPEAEAEPTAAAEVPIPEYEEPPAAVHHEPVVEAAPEPVALAEMEDDVLELTDKVETLGDLDVYTPSAAPEPTPEPAPSYEPAPPMNLGAGLVSDPAANAAAAAFSHLSASVLMPREGRTLEDVVREMLRPMLQQWLDVHLPGIVQESVRAEVERISRGGRVG